MRNNKLKSVRESWSHSKFFIGKNRVLSKALGGTEAEEYAEGLSMLAKCLRNECGLLATNQARAEVEEFFRKVQRKKGWLTEFNIRHDMSSPFRIDEVSLENKEDGVRMSNSPVHESDPLTLAPPADGGLVPDSA